MEEHPSYPQLSVVIPAFNEERRLPPTLLEAITYLDQRGTAYELIVVDDGSNDRTPQMVQALQRFKPEVRLIRVGKNRGKGAAVRSGMLSARGKLRLFADADGSTPFAELDRLERALSAGADIAIGSRAKRAEDTRVQTRWYRKFLGQSFNRIVNALIVPGIKDTQCGFKLFNARAADIVFAQQRSDGFSFDVEILYIAQKVGLKIAEIPINWENVPGSKVNLVVDATKMFCDIFRFLRWHRNLEQSSS
jgi:dolichyl-phosphate beta-glucosyltransferase